MRTRSVIAVCVAALSAGSEIQLLPAGTFRPTDGRPVPGAGWKIDAAIAAQVIAHANARENPFPIDYEHQALRAAENGQPAPAAGWFKKLEWREGQGLYAVDVQWTERAKAMIEAGEYRYLSPVFLADRKTGAVIRLVMAALTNTPALDGMDDVAMRAAARYQLDEDLHMNETLKKLAVTLSLNEAATEAEMLAACVALTARAKTIDGLQAEIVALKAREPDPAKFVPVATMKALQDEVSALSTQIREREVGELVSTALAEAKLLPAQEAWARGLGKNDLAALKSYLATAQPVAALQGTQTGGKSPAGDKAKDAAKLTEEQLAVCSRMGLEPEDYAAQLAA